MTLHESRILEIRPGTGGEEAALFAQDLARMYERYAAKKGWRFFILDTTQSDFGGLKSFAAEVTGEGTKTLDKESGVHRVQRIPKTEKSGRIHTSTVSVAVLPKVEARDVELNPNDLKIDTFRSSGRGGQNVNKVETAVRITHLPTGLVASCQRERSQAQNKERALEMLRAKLKAIQEVARAGSIQEIRRAQIGSMERAEKIRTYNFPQDRLTDHRVKKSWRHLEEILEGNLDPIINSVKTYA